MPAALAEPRASSNPFATAEPWTADRPAGTDWRRPSASDPARVFTAAGFVEHLRSLGHRVIARHAYWQVQCPAHEDHEPSLTVRSGRMQPVAFYCHAGCSHDEVLAAAGLGWANVLNRTGSSSFVVRGLVTCDHDNSDDGFEGMSFKTLELGLAHAAASHAPAFVADLDGELPQVERDYAIRKVIRDYAVDQYVEHCVVDQYGERLLGCSQ